LDQCDIAGPWWRTLNKPRPYAFALLILTGLILELVVHFWFGISVVYTHFFYLIIVIAGLWYGRRVIWIALFFGGLHIVVTYLVLGMITPDALMRAIMLCIVAFVVGIIVDQMNCYRMRLEDQNRELKEVNARLSSSREAFETANKKLNLLSGITRHDIRNQLLSLLGFIELAKRKTTDPEVLHFIDQEEKAAEAITRQIEFTKNYENIGVHAPRWQNVGAQLEALRSLMPAGDIEISISMGGLEVFADPLLEKVFENLIDNSRRHGERVRHILFSTLQYGMGEIAIVYEDDGIGVHEDEKDRIFEKGFGKNTGLGLFLSREILSITGLSIKESGVYGIGARFEILVPPGKFRFTKPATNVG
jgi:signal transduction histidine kinase